MRRRKRWENKKGEGVEESALRGKEGEAVEKLEGK